MALTRRDLIKPAATGAAGLVISELAANAQANSQYPETGTIKSEGSGIHYIGPDTTAEFHHPYFLYAPGGTDPTQPTATADEHRPSDRQPLIVAQNDRSTRNVETLLANANDGLRPGRLPRQIADELHSPALYSVLPYEPADGSFRNLDQNALRTITPRHERRDLQLLAMIDDARQRLAAEPYDVAK
jgi:hypothetical protein